MPSSAHSHAGPLSTSAIRRASSSTPTTCSYVDIAITELYREAFGSWGEAMSDARHRHAGRRGEHPLPARRCASTSASIWSCRRAGSARPRRRRRSRSGARTARSRRSRVRHVVVDAERRRKAPIPERGRGWRCRSFAPSERPRHRRDRRQCSDDADARDRQGSAHLRHRPSQPRPRLDRLCDRLRGAQGPGRRGERVRRGAARRAQRADRVGAGAKRRRASRT